MPASRRGCVTRCDDRRAGGSDAASGDNYRAVVPAATLDRELAQEVERLALAHGLDVVGVASAEPLVRARQALEARKAAGLHGGMAFTYRNPRRATTPGELVEGARAIVVGARRYRSVPDAERPRREPVGRVARYAWEDSYAPVRRALGAVAAHLRAAGHEARVLVDDNALVDREVAYRAGLGWFGKNANLLLPGARGSWFVLGSVVTSAPLPVAEAPVADGCGACRRCLDACPTGAIVAPGVVDANRCLAWLVQKAGLFPREHREALGDRIYGCDDCQEVCPPNVRLDRTGARARAADHPSEAALCLPGRAPEPWVPLLDLLAADDATLLARHGAWYIPERDPRWLRRNALVALGNVADGDDAAVVDTLVRFLAHADPTLRAHAVWAARRLGRHDLLGPVVGDDAPEVLEELAARAPTARGPAPRR
jgi:epoxyqueuosine reductase